MQAEAGQALVGDLVKPYQKTINGVKSVERTNLSDFMTQLRDGELSYLRKAPTKESFAALYKTMYGSVPSQKAIDAYDAIIDISDTTWQIKSSERLKRIVAEGGVYAEFTDDFADIVYRVDNVKVKLPDDELVLDFATGRSIRKAELNPDQIVFKVPSTYMDHLFVTNVVGTTKEQTLVSGTKISSGFKTLLGSFGKKQAQLAVLQVNNITRKVRALMDIQETE